LATVIQIDHNEHSSVAIDILKRDGCLVIEGLLSSQKLSSLQLDLQKHFDCTPDCQGDFYGYATKRIGTLFSKSEMCQEMAIMPLILKIMDEFLLPSCSQYQINLTQAISIGPDEKKQIMHQDDPMFPFLHPSQEVMLNCMWAVDDFTEENGATVVVPGSHLWPRTQALNLAFENLPPHLITQGVMKKGSVLIYLGSLYHCGGENRTSQRRCGAVISYSLGWLRQAENSYLGYTRKELMNMPEKLQKLLGYFVHEPNLGSVNGIDPYDYIIKNDKDKLFTEFVPQVVKPLLEEYRKSFQKKAA
jgi:ectoine hydroxylase-related dioxygenase (phytanoyl-CoA dioxygenase family)